MRPAFGFAGLVAAVWLGACDAGKPAGDSTGTGGAASGGAPGPGSGGSGTGGNAAPNPVTNISLDDALPWFLSVHPETTTTMVVKQADTVRTSIIHIAVPASPASYTVSTHEHVEVVGRAHTISFSARMTEGGPLRVYLRRSLDGTDYIAAAAAGNPWPSVVVQAGTGWQQFEVAIADLAPTEGAPAVTPPLSGFMLGFVVEATNAVELDLDNVYIR